MRSLIVFLFISLSISCLAQNPRLAFAERMPEFPGGDAAFKVFFDSVMVYPDSAKKYGKEGTVYVYFEVGKDGTCSNFSVRKGVPGAPDLDREALRVLSMMPKWIPGEMNGKKVKVGMTVPVKFVLD